MSEILGILIQILFILIIFSFPTIIFTTSKRLNISQFSLIDKISINLIFLINILLFTSLLNIDSKYILYLYAILIIFFSFINFKKFSLKNLKIDYYFIILLLFIILISIDIAHELYFGWDAKTIWFFKALNFYQNQKFENLKNFAVFDYPHLGTYVWYFFWKYSLNSFEYLGRIAYVFIYVLSIFSITECLKLRIYERIIFAILLIFSTYNYELFSGLQDVLVFSFILISSKFIYYFFEKKYKPITLELICILLGIANILCWVKNEALFFVFFLLFCLFITNNLNSKTKIVLVVGALTILFIRILVFSFYETELNPGYQFDKTFNIDFFELINKTKIIFFYLIIYLAQNPIYFLTLPVLVYVSYKYRMKDITKFTLYFMILNFSFIYVVYLFKIDDVETQIRHSMKRVLFETSGFYFLSIVNFINNYSDSFNFKNLSKNKTKKI